MAEMRTEIMAEMRTEIMADIRTDVMADMRAEMMPEMRICKGVRRKMTVKMMDINECLLQSREKLSKTDAELKVRKDDLASAKDALAEVMIDLATIKDNLVTAKDDLVPETDGLEREVTIMKAPLLLHVCGSNTDFLSISYQTIPFPSLLYSSTNTEGGGLDMDSGVFTGGSYTVYWGTTARLDYGEYVNIYLQKNGENIQESLQVSAYTGPSGWVYDQGKVLLINNNTTIYIV